MWLCMIGIYKIENKANGKVYIGQSTNLHKRIQDHKRNLIKNKHINPHLQSAWNKYGEESFDFCIVKECEKEILYDLEVEYIKRYDSFKNGYNRSEGGESGNRGRRMSEEEKAIRSRMYSGCNNPFYNKKHSDETKEKIRLFHTGKKLSDEHKKKIGISGRGRKASDSVKAKMRDRFSGSNNPMARKVYCDGKVFGSVVEFYEHFEIDKSINSVRKWLSGEIHMPIEWYILGTSYVGESNSVTREVKNGYQIVCNGVEYTSIESFAREYCLYGKTVSSWLNKVYKMPEKFYNMGLRYAHEDDMSGYVKADRIHFQKRMVICDGVEYETIEGFAKSINKTSTCVRYWLNGKRKMPQEFLDKNLRYA